jgi:hypothetical protein
MGNRLQAGAATLAFIGSVALAATAVAQTSSPAPGGAASSLNLTPDAIKSFLSSLASVATQSAPSGFKPSVGDSVPQNVQLNPMPSDAKANVPQAQQDQHVAKVDDDDDDSDADVVLIVDPITRQIVGIVAADDSGTTGMGSPSPSGSSSPSAPSPSSGSNK